MIPVGREWKVLRVRRRQCWIYLLRISGPQLTAKHNTKAHLWCLSIQSTASLCSTVELRGFRQCAVWPFPERLVELYIQWNPYLGWHWVPLSICWRDCFRRRDFTVIWILFIHLTILVRQLFSNLRPRQMNGLSVAYIHFQHKNTDIIWREYEYN